MEERDDHRFYGIRKSVWAIAISVLFTVCQTFVPIPDKWKSVAFSIPFFLLVFSIWGWCCVSSKRLLLFEIDHRKKLAAVPILLLTCFVYFAWPSPRVPQFTVYVNESKEPLKIIDKVELNSDRSFRFRILNSGEDTTEQLTVSFYAPEGFGIESANEEWHLGPPLRNISRWNEMTNIVHLNVVSAGAIGQDVWLSPWVVIPKRRPSPEFSKSDMINMGMSLKASTPDGMKFHFLPCQLFIRSAKSETQRFVLAVGY
jgi:hypothetical protein